MKEEIIYEFKEVTESQTLVLNNPAEVTFINQGVGGGIVTINNVINIQPSSIVIAGGADYYDRVTLKNNVNEVDTTDYNVKMPVGTKLIVICKYYRK
jgi:hypothetical protein